MMAGGNQSHAAFSKIGDGVFNLNSIDLTDGFNSPSVSFFDFSHFDGAPIFNKKDICGSRWARAGSATPTAGRHHRRVWVTGSRATPLRYRL